MVDLIKLSVFLLRVISIISISIVQLLNLIAHVKRVLVRR